MYTLHIHYIYTLQTIYIYIHIYIYTHTQYIEDTISEDLGGGFTLAARLVGSDLHRSRLAQAAVDANLVAAAVNHLLLDLWGYKNPTQTIPRCSIYGKFT